MTTGDVAATGSKETPTMHTASNVIDYDSGDKQRDGIMTTARNVQTVSELSQSATFRIVSLWILFVIGVVGNLLVLMLVIWRRNRKQVSLVLPHASEL